jgi:hypothetical protein
MQTQLPFFPESVELFNPNIGVFKHDDFVYYMHNGSPLFCHSANDRTSYRYITANLVQTKMCTPSEIARVFGVGSRSIQINVKALREKGADWFFNREETRGKCYKFNAESFVEAQKMLDEGKPNKDIAKRLNVSVSAVKYHIKSGKLKKNQNSQ